MMLGYKIRYDGDAILSMVAEEVNIHEDEDIDELVIAMFQRMYENNGIGLAANQVGVLQRVIVIDVNRFKQEFINPVITKEYGGRSSAREGCLSFPRQQVFKTRYKQIVVEGFDKDMKPIRRKLKGLAARCVQHEVDHLDGITIV